jgi:hypothetical protein
MTRGIEGSRPEVLPLQSSLSPALTPTPEPPRAPLWTRLRVEPIPRLATLGVLLLAGLVLRGWIMAISVGTNDIEAWRDFAERINKDGLGHCYETLRHLNHPPLVALGVSWVASLASALGVRFAVAFKSVVVLADVGTAVLLYRIWQSKARIGLVGAAAYALAPLALLVTAYHGNTDPVLAGMCLLAVWLLDERRHLAAGLALGAAFNIKLTPLLLVPLLLGRCTTRKEMLRFLAGLAAGGVPFAVALLAYGKAFAQKVLSYSPPPTQWGIGALLPPAMGHRVLYDYAEPVFRILTRHGRILLGVLAVALALLARRRPHWSLYEAAAATMGVFLVLLPGFGIQYAIWVLPLLLAADLAGGAVYGVVAGMFALFLYVIWWTGKSPYYTVFLAPYPPAAVLVGVVAWTLLALRTARLIRRGMATGSGPRSVG